MTLPRPQHLFDGMVSAKAGIVVGSARHMVVKIPINSAPTGSEQDTGVDIPAKCLVLDAYVDARTAEATGATKTLDVGLLSSESGGDADGFLDGVSVAATGVKTGAATYTDGTSQNYISANTIGALLFSGLVGADGAGTAGTINRRKHICNGTARSISYTSGS